MPPVDQYLASMARLSISQSCKPTLTSLPRYLAPSVIFSPQTRHASTIVKKKDTKKRKPISKEFKRHRIVERDFPRWTLSEAMRILRATEVGQPPARSKYEIHIHLKATRGGPVIRGSLRLPNPVQSDWRIAVICPEGSDIANAATSAGAVAVGEDTLFEAIRQEKINFDRLLCHESSEKALQKAQLGRILGPKGLMPSAKTKTIVKDVDRAIRDSSGSADYRERDGCIRMAVAQLGHSGEQVRANVQAVMAKIKSECAEMAENFPKDVHEVVLSSTFGPALTLNGKLESKEDKVPLVALATPM